MPIVAWYMLSNESYINRVMRDVLPTSDLIQQRLNRRSMATDLENVPLCSPRKTNLRNELSIRSYSERGGVRPYLNFFSGFE